MTRRKHTISRREAMQSLGAAAGWALTSGCTPAGPGEGSDTDVLADPTERLQTFVVLMMENRSFDHYFGSPTLLEGRDDVEGLTADMSNTNSAGEVFTPHRLDIDCFADPGHGWSACQRQFNGGRNDGFVTDYEARSSSEGDVMGYYAREDLPVFHALLEGAALCDHWYSSVLGPTWPNRFYSVCGTSEGIQSTGDLSLVPFMAKSIFKQLDEAGVDYRIYFHEVPFPALVADIDRDKMVPIEQFFDDAATGNLPAVAWIEPGYSTNDGHPPHPIALGQVLVGSIYQALARSPQWEGSTFIVNYDEHGGFHDHVAPPTVEDARADEGFNQLGFRVPAFVAGPWAKVGVCSTGFEHCSVLATLQQRFGLASLTERDAAAEPLWDCFDPERMAAGEAAQPVEVPTLDLDPTDFADACFSAITPNQPELWEMVDTGVIPERLDRRGDVAEMMDRLLVRAAKLGVVRFVGRLGGV